MTWAVDWEAEPGFGFVRLSVPGFGEVKVTVLPARDGELTPKTLRTLEELRSLAPTELARLSELLWADCLDAFERVSYGADEPDDPVERIEHLKTEFGLSGPEDALGAAPLRGITVPEDDVEAHGYEGRYALFSFDAPWYDLPQGVLRDGAFVAVRGNGCWIGEFEPREG